MNSLKTFRRTKKTENSLGDKKRSTIAGKSSKISSIAGSKTISVTASSPKDAESEFDKPSKKSNGLS